MGILANHVPSVEALKAGVVEVIEDAGSQSKKWFSKLRFVSLGSIKMEAVNGINENDI
jgi:F-type H+-transporting ATPase subunit delta